jgi:hypothetical protein
LMAGPSVVSLVATSVECWAEQMAARRAVRWVEHLAGPKVARTADRWAERSAEMLDQKWAEQMAAWSVGL